MKRLFILFVVALATVILLSPCTPQAAGPTASTTKKAVTTAVKAQTGGIMKILIKGAANRFGYPPTITGPDRDYAPPFFNRLITIGNDGKYKPELALSWDASKDGRIITFKLRHGVTFHDGTPFNAQAAKANLDKLIPPNPVILDGIASVDVVDDYTIKIRLSSFNNLILYQIASNYACYMYSPTALQKNGDDWAATHPVGTGPFMLKDFQRNISLTYIKNANYWEKGLPYLDGITMQSVPDPMTQILTFKAGQANAIYDIIATNAAELRDAGYTLYGAPGSLFTLGFDSKNSEIFSNPKVRQAIEYAVDKEAICSGPGLGLYTPLYQVVPSTSPDYNPACPPRKYDPNKAKKLLAEAGYANGFSFKITFPDTAWKEGLVAFQNYLEKVGIKMEINYISSPAFQTIRATGKIEKGTACHTPYNALSNSLYMMDFYFRSDTNQFQYVDKPAGIDALLVQAKAARDLAIVTKLNRQISKLIYDDVTVVPLWSNLRIAVLDKSVQDPGWFIANDSNNNQLGTRTWLKN
jgi:peptide/nickel transport system substrate-binding protein